jgi:hypothetical protein
MNREDKEMRERMKLEGIRVTVEGLTQLGAA